MNRYERKKNINIAIKAFKEFTNENKNEVKLIIAGGYDDKVEENR